MPNTLRTSTFGPSSKAQSVHNPPPGLLGQNATTTAVHRRLVDSDQGFSDHHFFQGYDAYSWLRYDLSSSALLLFIAGIWWIWRVRNVLCLDSEMISFCPLKLRIMDYALLLKNCYFNTHETLITKLVKWNALGGTGMILNVDGSSIGNPSISSFRGLIRNADGAWVRGFFGNLGVTNILHAELMPIYKGLLLAWELNMKDMWCYSDSKMAIKLITDPIDAWHHYAVILNNIKGHPE
ncbi:hypothetical protein TSUD_182620 [Trifolium subterraneum]|uniref:RNase H type-1 domain-containing protein n=1 Tax=Trifolium subterraneum TaxID=3900 RepID=A0A2Z6M2H7_TRISU|nr:hypothetical protein TSUD_182620 [Trifolium subterraneum]